MTMWVVLDAAGAVVVIAAGKDAHDAVQGWVEEGYRVVCVGDDQCGVA